MVELSVRLSLQVGYIVSQWHGKQANNVKQVSMLASIHDVASFKKIVIDTSAHIKVDN